MEAQNGENEKRTALSQQHKAVKHRKRHKKETKPLTQPRDIVVLGRLCSNN